MFKCTVDLSHFVLSLYFVQSLCMMFTIFWFIYLRYPYIQIVLYFVKDLVTCAFECRYRHFYYYYYAVIQDKHIYAGNDGPLPQGWSSIRRAS